jgi:alpha-ketoglutarate-dependent taurine dioxygenase
MQSDVMYERQDKEIPIVVEGQNRNLEGFIESNKYYIDTTLIEHGAILFRGFDVGSIEVFQRVSKKISENSLKYEYRSTPRTVVAEDMFTATEYPASQEIPLHNENAYQRVWPRKILFYCGKPASAGGETPIADLRVVTRSLPVDLMSTFRAKGVKYIRHYRPYVDLPWQAVFQTQDKDQLSEICHRNNIIFEWVEPNLLRTEQICQGTAIHPETGEETFFNQAHLFHVSSLEKEIAKGLIDLFGADRLPRDAQYGDGSPIAAETLDVIRTNFLKNRRVFNWVAGDVLLLDNMRVAHGRAPFAGERKHYAKLLEPYCPEFSITNVSNAGGDFDQAGAPS